MGISVSSSGASGGGSTPALAAVLAVGNTDGGAGATFTGTLTGTLTGNATGTAANITGTAAIANGGTGQTTKAPAFNALSPITTLGNLIYGSAANTSSRLAGNTLASRRYLVQTGTGSVSNVPGWGAIGSNDLPANISSTNNIISLSLSLGDINGVDNGTILLIDSVNGLFNFSSGPVQIEHLEGFTSAPTIVAGAGAGSSPTVSIAGTDLAGKVTVTSGTLPTASGAICTVTFNIAYASAPYVVFSPANAATALLSGTSMIYVTSTTTTFVFTAGTVGLTAATAYAWNYHAMQ